MIQEHDRPYPPRYRWLKRLAIAYSVLLLLLIVAWIAWDRVAVRRFDAEVARLRSAGQMALAADFNQQPPVPDSENAALLLKQAMKFTLTKAQDDFDSTIDWSLKLTDAQRATLQSYLTMYGPQVQLARQARQRTKSDWGQTYGTPLIATMYPSLNQARELAMMLANSASAEHLDGNDAETIELIRDIRHESAMMDADCATLVEHLVAIGVGALAVGRLDDIVDEIAIESDRPPLRQASTQPSTRPARPASRQQIRELIAELLDERATTDGLVRSFQGEQAMVLDTIAWLARSPNASLTAVTGGGGGRSSVEPVVTFVMRPMFRLSAVRMSQRHAIRARNAAHADFATMTANLPDVERVVRTGTPLRQASRVVEMILEPSVRRLYLTQAEHLATRRALAIKLALRLYQLDHDGRLPDELSALVPTYLTAVPLDPFATDGRAMRYVREMTLEGVRTPVVYSVGENLTDDAASTQPARIRSRLSAGQSVFENARERADFVFPLKRPAPVDPPPPPPPDPSETDEDQGQPPIDPVQQPDGQDQQQ